jgi:hypothetical protein
MGARGAANLSAFETSAEFEGALTRLPEWRGARRLGMRVGAGGIRGAAVMAWHGMAWRSTLRQSTGLGSKNVRQQLKSCLLQGF